MFSCCDCEPTALTMVRARLWPASPRLPKLAFTFELLEWAEALLLECQVALGDFCKALHFKSPHLTNKVNSKHTLSLEDLHNHVCFLVMVVFFFAFHLHLQERGSVMISMDALFGLPRKKSAGQSHRDPLHGHIFFKDQPSVDEHVASSSRRNAYDKVLYKMLCCMLASIFTAIRCAATS